MKTSMPTTPQIPATAEPIPRPFVLETPPHPPAADAEKRRTSCDTFTVEDPMSSRGSLDARPAPLLAKPRPAQVSFHMQCFNHANANNGKFLSKLHKKKIFLYLCELGHKFFLTKKEIIDGVWCNTCRKTHSNLKRFARENRGQLLTDRTEKTVSFRCEAGHTWETPCRKAFWHWCKICSKNTKQILKDLNKQENIRIEQEKIRRQNELLEEARRKFLERRCGLGMHGGSAATNTNFCSIMLELEGLARRHAAEYFRLKKAAKTEAGFGGATVAGDAGTWGSPGDCAPCGGSYSSSQSSPQGDQQVQQEQQGGLESILEAQLEESRVVETYKLLIFPEETFKLYLRSLALDDLRKEFRRLAILVHPDKNQHPHAKSAFQKLYNGFMEVSQANN